MFKNKRLLALFFTMIVMMLGFGLIIPIMPFYVERFGAGGAELGLLMASFSFMQLLFSPFWGELSDRHGRKRIMMIGVIGNALSMLLMGLAHSLGLLFVSRIIGGLFSAATMPTAMAYIGDTTTREDRSSGMGVIGAAMGIGMVLGPGMGGWLSDISLSAPFFAASSLSLISLGVIWFVLPESLAPEKITQGGSWLAELRRFRGPDLAMLWKELFGSMGFLLVLAFLVNFALANFEGIFGLFANEEYGYGPSQVGSVMMVVGLVSSLVQMLLTGPATRRLGEANLIKLSLAASALGFISLAAAPNNFLVPLAVGFFVFSNAMLRPAIQAITSRQARGGQGVALGLNNAYQSLGRVVGPLWAGLLFDFHHYLPYLSGAFILLAAFVFSLRRLHNPDRPPTHEAGQPLPAD